jgi:hypothetical protein
MAKPQFDCRKPDLEVACRIALELLVNELNVSSSLQMLPAADSLKPYVEFVGDEQDYDLLHRYVIDASGNLSWIGSLFQVRATDQASGVTRATFPGFISLITER